MCTVQQAAPGQYTSNQAAIVPLIGSKTSCQVNFISQYPKATTTTTIRHEVPAQANKRLPVVSLRLGVKAH